MFLSKALGLCSLGTFSMIQGGFYKYSMVSWPDTEYPDQEASSCPMGHGAQTLTGREGRKGLAWRHGHGVLGGLEPGFKGL